MSDEQLRQIFGYKEPTTSQAKVCVTLRTSFCHLARLLIANTHPGRAQALALTALQQASWAAIAAAVEPKTEG